MSFGELWTKGRRDGSYPAAGGLSYLAVKKPSGPTARPRGVFYCQSKIYKGIRNLLPATHWGQRRGHSPVGTEESKDFSEISTVELSLDEGVDVCLPLSNYYFDHSQYQTSS